MRRCIAVGEVWKESSGRLARLRSYARTGWSNGEACVRPAASCRSRREKRQREERTQHGCKGEKRRRGGGLARGVAWREGERGGRGGVRSVGGGGRWSALHDSVRGGGVSGWGGRGWAVVVGRPNMHNAILQLIKDF
jgi:hypothetical protein